MVSLRGRSPWQSQLYSLISPGMTTTFAEFYIKVNMKIMKKYINLIRFKQWTKNLIIFSGLIFSKNIFHIAFTQKVILTFLSFCFISSFIYILNDLKDIKNDKAHPEKSKRVLASGEVSIISAWILAFILLVFSILLAFIANIIVVRYIFLYVIINLLYIYHFRNKFILDILFISTGFVIRAMVGAAAISVLISPWLIVCSFLISLLISLGKRRYELELLSFQAQNFRRSLEKYSTNHIDNFIQIISSVTIMAYSTYTFTAPNLPANNSMMLTIPFVIYGIFRYNYILKTEKIVGIPEEILIKDKPILINLIFWIISCTFILYFFR